MNCIVDRIRKLVFKEMDLLLEYEAFETLRRTNFAKEPYIFIPTIDNMSLRCLIRDFGEGKTLAKIYDDKNFILESPEVHKTIIKSLESLHRCAINTAFNQLFIMSDLHLGNISFESDTKKLTIFDPGQNDTITMNQSTALLWTLVALSEDSRMKKFRTPTIKYLAQLIETEPKAIDVIQQKIGRAYDTCRNIKNPRYRFAQLLTACEYEGVILPGGFFACAKMLDTLTSQEKLLELPDIVKEEVSRLLIERMSLVEKIYAIF